jgi:hypothetical protein
VKVAIVGSRQYPDLDAVREYVRGIPPGTIVVSGGAQGVDKVAELEAKEQGLNVEIWYPRWDLHGKGAGFARNRAIVHSADRVVAFWDGESRGTKHTIHFAGVLKKRCDVFGPRVEP